MVTEPRRSRRKDRLGSIAICLAGLLLCVHVLFDQPQREVFSSGNDDLEAIRLRSGEHLEVLHDVTFSHLSRQKIENVPVYEKLYGERYLWIHMQYVRAAGQEEVASVVYVQFRNEEDAHWGKKQTDAWEGFPRPVISRVFGTFLVRFSGAEQGFEDFSEVVFDSIEKRLSGGGA